MKRQAGAFVRCLGIATALLATGCGLAGLGTNTPTHQPTTPQDSPPLVWTDCHQELECGSLDVPIDHGAPDGPTIMLELVRRPARSSTPQGSIVVNPGGPGVSGVDYVRHGFQLDPITSTTYHLVGYDPRGTGADLIDCTSAFRPSPLLDGSPDSTSEYEMLDGASSAIAASCAQANPSLLPHLTASDHAADLEQIRLALNEPQLHYFGASYGTRFGLAYASAFPQTTGLMVLDGVINPTHTLTDLLLQQAEAFEHQFHRMGTECHGTPTCPEPTLTAGFLRVRDRLERNGAAAAFGTEELDWAALRSLYNDNLWPTFSRELRHADLRHDYDGLHELARWLTESDAFTAYLATVCADLPHPQNTDDWDDVVAEASAIAPIFGSTVVNELRPCVYWPNPTQAPSSASAPAPPPALPHQLVLLAAKGDVATPPANAMAVHQNWPNTVLVEADAQRHTAYGTSSCVTDLIQRYFIVGQLDHQTYSCP